MQDGGRYRISTENGIDSGYALMQPIISFRRFILHPKTSRNTDSRAIKSSSNVAPAEWVKVYIEP